jgi:hypothetical protein
MSDEWTSGCFEVSRRGPTSGRVYRGLGLYRALKGSPKGRRPPRWSVVHLGSGHRVCMIDAHEHDAVVIATRIAECADWDWDGLDGWRNREPQIMDKLWAATKQYAKSIRFGGGGQSESEARRIAIARAGA